MILWLRSYACDLCTERKINFFALWDVPQGENFWKSLNKIREPLNLIQSCNSSNYYSSYDTVVVKYLGSNESNVSVIARKYK